MGRLVTKPLARFDDLTGCNGAFTLHENNNYHKINVLSMDDFRKFVAHYTARFVPAQ